MDNKALWTGPLVPEIPANYLTAGRDYHKSLERLGFVPELTIWARDEAVDDWVLLICTRMLDTIGALPIMNVLFKAYDAAITPSEISPFIIRLESPDAPIIREIIATLNGWMRPTVWMENERGERFASPADDQMSEMQIGELSFRHGWRYVAGQGKPVQKNAFKAFKSFSKLVEARVAA